MAQELIDRAPSPRPRTDDATVDRGTFPAGTALAALGLWFVLTRIMVRLTVVHPAIATIAMGAGVVGAVLASIAVLVHTASDLRPGLPRAVRAIAIVRMVFAAPVLVLVIAATGGEPAEFVQWAALVGAVGTLAISLGLGLVRARGMILARGALALLLVGELIELLWPPAHSAAPADSAWPALFGRLGAVSEVCAFVGAIFALGWSVRSTARVAGPARTRLFVPMPVVVSLLISMLAMTILPSVGSAVAHNAFGVRFDLLASSERALSMSAADLVLYALVPEMLVCAAAISVAAVLFDRGAAARRTLGWIAVLLAGFGAVRLAGPMDPIRLVTVCLAAVLLERAASLEIADRDAPA